MLAALAVLTALHVVAERPVRLAAPGLGTANLDEKLGAFYSEHLAHQLKATGIEVFTQREIQSLLGLERQKQLLGCSESSESCLGELANALGADAVVLGDVARLGDRYAINLKVIAASDGRTLSLVSETADSEDGVRAALTRGAQALSEQTLAALGRTPPHRPGPSRKLAAVPLAVGLAALAGGVASILVSQGARSQLESGQPGEQALSVLATGRATEALSAVLFGVGAAGLAAAGVLWFMLAERSPVVVSVGPAGASVWLTGALP